MKHRIRWAQHPLLAGADRGLVTFANGYTASIFCKTPHAKALWFEVAVMRGGKLLASTLDEVVHDEAGLQAVLSRIESLPIPDGEA